MELSAQTQSFGISRSTTAQNGETLVSRHPVLLVIVIGTCLSPLFLNLLGVDFTAQIISLAEIARIDRSPQGLHAILSDRNLVFDVGKGALIYAILEWTSVMVALLTAMVAFSHFLTDKENNATSIIGLALLTCGAMECFHTLASLRIVGQAYDHIDFMPFTWSLARTFNAAIFLIGAIICLKHIGRKIKPDDYHVEVRLMLIFCAGFIIFTFILMWTAALIHDLPQTIYTQSLFKRPFELVPIALFAATIPFLLRLYKRSPSLLNATLLISVAPHLVLEFHMLFGSSSLFDNHFMIAHALKIFAYALPFYGLIHNYMYAYNRVNHALYHDDLTSTTNRNYFYLAAEATISRASRENQKVAFFYMDLNGFKKINDTHGHEAGDAVLKEFAARVQQVIRTEDCFARMGGDEFVVVVSNFEHAGNLQGIAQKILQSMKAPVQTVAGELYVSVSIGISLFPEERDLNQLLHNADLAMYEAKRDSAQHIKFYSRDMSEQHCNTLRLQTDLGTALASGQLYLVYQPIYEGFREEPTAFEALLRWNHPERGEILPRQFVPIAERSGLIVEIGNWVIESGCAQLAQWRALSGEPLRLFINCSAKQIGEINLAPTIASALDKYKLSGESLTLEIEENQLVANATKLSENILVLRQMGVSIAMDNYGAGSASVSQLQKLPIDTIKIDRSLVTGSTECAQSRAVVKSTVELAKELGLNIVAEGVESLAEFNLMRDIGCTGVQGFFLASPMRTENCEAIWTNRARTANDKTITELLGFS